MKVAVFKHPYYGSCATVNPSPRKVAERMNQWSLSEGEAVEFSGKIAVFNEHVDRLLVENPNLDYRSEDHKRQINRDAMARTNATVRYVVDSTELPPKELRNAWILNEQTGVIGIHFGAAAEVLRVRVRFTKGREPTSEEEAAITVAVSASDTSALVQMFNDMQPKPVVNPMETIRLLLQVPE